MKKISIYVPKSAVMEAVTPAYRLFSTANRFLEARGEAPLFDVEFVGLERHIQAQDGEYTVTASRLLPDVKKTDMVIIPALYGDLPQALERNRAAVPWIVDMYGKGAEVVSLCLGAFLLADTGLIDGKRCSLVAPQMWSRVMGNYVAVSVAVVIVVGFVTLTVSVHDHSHGPAANSNMSSLVLVPSFTIWPLACHRDIGNYE